MDSDSDLGEKIKACRTCGIHYVTPSKHQLQHLFQSSPEHSEIMLIRLELSQWNVEVAENDGFPQYVCNTCIHKFDQVFALRTACINAQNEFRKFYAVPNGNIPNVKVKTELPDPEEEQPMCDFVYVDDLSDTEYDGATPFNFPHMPIKEEVIEAATIPMEESVQPINIVESASKVVAQMGPSSSHLSKTENIAARQPTIAVQVAFEKIECNLCQHLLSNQEEYKQHLQQAHRATDFECHICGKEFKNSTPERFKFHMKWHTLNKNLKCAFCGFMCRSTDALREHKRTNHRILSCKICRKGILTKKMKSHLRQHELKYSCEYCTEAFATEDKRENHIWQIHAKEDSHATPNSIPIFETTCTQTINGGPFNEPQEEMLRHEPQKNLLYKFMCAHCEHRFMEQIDLETHVNEEHRVKSHLVSIGTETVAFVADATINETAEMIQNEDVNENANINVFEQYDNDDEMHVPVKNDLPLSNTPLLSQDFIFPSNSPDFVTENGQCDETQTALNEPSVEEPDGRESEDEAISNFPSYVASDLNTFACAKCSKTFASIEHLRQHHEQHLAVDQQQQQLNTTDTKSKFKCNLCEKSFNLKFILNRHVKKHKYAPI